jgi:NAD-dependent SIR2 family protein deacetylase
MGIPDFRTDGAGIYAMVGEKAAQYGLGDPQKVFDIELFREDPEIFYKFANKILPKVEGVSLTHTFMRSLDQADKLLRIYTQNVDDLEIEAHIRGEKVVQMHGTMRNFRCMRCEYTISGTAHTQALRDGKVPYCPRVDCLKEAEEAARPRKRLKATRDQPSRARSVRRTDRDDVDEVAPAVLKVCASNPQLWNEKILNSCSRISCSLANLFPRSSTLLSNVISHSWTWFLSWALP